MGGSFKKKIGENFKAIFLASTIAFFAISLMLIYAPNFVHATATANDNLGVTVNVNPFVETSINATVLTYAGLNPASTDNSALQNRITLINTYNSNTAIDIYIYGTDMTGDGTIACRNTSVNVTYTETESLTPGDRVNTTAQGMLNGTTASKGYVNALAVSSGTTKDSNVSFSFWQDIPAGQTAGAYTSTITLHSVQAGETP